jgi:hypothetical protein
MRAVLVLLACVVLAALSLLVHAVPGFDAHGWLLWGRELTSGGLEFDTAAYPSWKPLPALFTTPLALTGSAAPALWLVVARAGGLVAAFLAYRLGARFAGPAAGAIAALGVALLAHWTTYTAAGSIEPLLAALVLGAADRHFAGRRTQALLLLALAGLGRHEVWALLGAYAVWLGAVEPRRRPLVAGVVVAVPVLWFGGDWLGSGHPLHGGHLARDSAETVHARADGLLLFALRDAAGLVALPLLAGAAWAVGGALRRRERPLLLLAAVALAWLAVDLALAAAGFPALARFMVPAGALVCVLGGVGLVRLARLPARPAVRVGIAAAVALAALPSLVVESRAMRTEGRKAATFARMAQSLDAAVAGAGGAGAVRACGWASANHGFQTRLAWRLRVRSADVSQPRGPGLAFAAHGRSFPELRELLAHPRRRQRPRRVAVLGEWSVYRVRAPRGRARAARRPVRTRAGFPPRVPTASLRAKVCPSVPEMAQALRSENAPQRRSRARIGIK